MNILTKMLVAAGTAAVALSPIAAAAAPAAQPVVRAAPADLGSSDLRGRRSGEDNDGTGLIFAVLAIAAVVAVYFITDDDDDDSPVSP